MEPYVLVLAQTSHEGAKYVRRAGLPRGRWRVVAKASSIRGIRRAHVHCLPGFHVRPDRHAILGELRYANCEWFDVEMPEPEVAVVDQGDGMGQQMTIAELIAGPGATDASIKEGALEEISKMLDEEVASDELPNTDEQPTDERWADSVYTRTIAERFNAIRDSNTLETEVTEAPKAKRRRKCADCGTLHFKDEPCARIDGVSEDAPVATPATMFD